MGADIRGRFIRNALLASAAMGCALLAATPSLAQARTFDIPADSASDAIRALARQSGLQVLAPVEDVRGIRTPALRGQYEPLDAVHRLIDGTGLQVVQTGPNTITIRRGAAPAQAGGQAAADASREGDSTAVEEVIVTGSRIKRAGFDTLQAAFSTGAKEIQERGYTNIIQALDETPGFAASGMNPVGTNQTTFGSGQAFADFFGLGSNRTLTLVNGRRFVTSNTPAGGNAGNPGGAGLQVDLNVIPVGLVERVETVAIGGAPVYGSDAIAGTVNIILKDDFQGLEASAQYGITGEGDAESQSYRLMVGGNFAEGRGNAVIGAEFAKQDGIQLSSRTGAHLALPNLGAGPALDVADDIVFGGMSEGGLPFLYASPGYPLGGGASDWISDPSGQPLQFGKNGDLVPYNVGRDVYGAGVPIYNNGGDGVRLADHNGLLAPSERTLINGTAHYDITPRIRAFVEAAYAHSQGDEPSDLAAFAQPLLGGNQVTYHLDNAFLSAATRNTLAANGVTDRFYVARNFSDLLETDGYLERTTVDLYRVVVGLQGDFDAWGKKLNWDVSYNYGRSRALTEMNYINSDRLVLALDAVDDGSGNIVCRSGGSCVPINLFGENNFSKAAANYVLDRGTAVSLNTQQVVTANLSGDLPFGISSQPIAFNIGAEHREERGGFSPDATLQAGSSLLGLDLASGYLPVPFSGYNTNEIYAETVIPLVSPDQNFAFIKSLSLEGAVRFVDNSRSGSATTWSAGGRFAPSLPSWGDGLLFRGVFMHAIRSPAIAELNSPASPTRGSIADPCDAVRYQSGNNPSARAANCAAELAALGYGSPADFHSTTTGLSPIGTVSGNPNLENEESDSWSLGFVYQPSLAPKFRFSMDWTNIKLEGGIQSLDIGDMLTACYDSSSSNPACNSFRRLTAAEVGPGTANPTRVAGDIANGYNTGYINTASLEFAGLIVAAEYSFDIEDLNAAWQNAGALRLSAKMFYTDKYDVIAFAGQEVTHSVGTAGRPEYSAAINVSYNRDKLDLNWNSLWTSSTKNDLFADADLLSPHWNNVDAYWKFNASIGYQVTPHLRAQVTVNNVFNTELSDAQLYSRAYTTYDLIGRTFLFNLQATF
jgi:iron complex outermembrane receptor protein